MTRVLLLSMRKLTDNVASCSQSEFEHVVEAVTDADRFDASPIRLQLSRRAYRYARLFTGSNVFAQKLAPSPRVFELKRDYDLFFPIFNHPHELYALAELPHWRERCLFAACFIQEVWWHLLPEYLLELLARFDWVFIAGRHAVEDVSRLTGTRCSYLPSGVDVLTFSPYPQLPSRHIAVCNIGRRSPITHEALLKLQRQRRDFFYYFDSVAASGADLKQRTFHVDAPLEHRALYASILQRSRYQIANRGRANEAHFTLRGDELSNRFFEGAAAGVVSLGEVPRLAEFRALFDWPDALIPVPFDAPEIETVLNELDDDPARLARIRRAGIYNSALRHDWVHRLRTVFDLLGLRPTDRMLIREDRLRSLAGVVRTLHDHGGPEASDVAGSAATIDGTKNWTPSLFQGRSIYPSFKTLQ